MRIQHNIMAMNAYRNYTNNVSAMQKNLEKLSSGYKINRAGDDAAGLAISEKMRAQITGLETAQKNAKDGISLVQTAEGALTEVHDMLNRMVELSTQSANGTYDNETDRYQLQKEMDQLRSEIDRIADSSNFNGIKLLDGSLSGREAQTITNATTEYGELSNFSVDNGMLPAVGVTQVSNTVLHVDKSDSDTGTKVYVDLHNTGFSNKLGETLTITMGGTTITVTGTGGDYMTASDLAKYIVDEINSGSSSTVKIGTTAAPAASSDGTFVLKDASNVTSTFTVDLDTSRGDDCLVFTQKNAPKTSAEEFNGFMDFTVEGGTRSDSLTAAFAASNGTATAAVTLTVVNGGGFAFNTGTAAITGGQLGADITLKFEVEVNGKNETFTITLTSDSTAADSDTTIKLTVGSDGNAKLANNKSATAANMLAEINKVLNAKIAAIDETSETDALAPVDNDYYNQASYTKIGKITLDGAIVNTAQGGGTGTATALTNTQLADKTLMVFSPDGTGQDDYQGKTLSENVTADNQPRLASTVFELTSDMVVDGASVKIGNSDYVFTTDKTLKTKAGYVYIGDLGTDGTNLAAADITTAAQRLTTAAKENTTYTVGNSGTAEIMVTEIEGQTDYDLRTKEGIEESLGFRGTNKTTVETIEIAAGKNLMLQIGDTSDSYNQLKVAIDDMHSSALGIGDISIADQDSASDAIQAIKDAINKVSDVRGTLGATQNRLDHTINNLSVMTENIQDAESTIRDTDIAEEMMAYTKNNILIQSAQAMLAQANQVPQGVLQLLG